MTSVHFNINFNFLQKYDFCRYCYITVGAIYLTSTPPIQSFSDFISISKNGSTFALSIRGALFVKQTQKRAEIIPIEKV